MGNDLFVQGWK